MRHGGDSGNDPNAWDVMEGAAKIAHLPWCSREKAVLIAAAPTMASTLKDIQTYARLQQQSPFQTMVLKLAQRALGASRGEPLGGEEEGDHP